MVELRCNTCPCFANGFCKKLKVNLPNGLAKLYYGGVVGIYSGDITYPSRCEIEKGVENSHELDAIVMISAQEILEEHHES
jgi:hypothetical protein